MKMESRNDNLRSELTRDILEGPKPLRDSSPIVARIKGVQTIYQLYSCSSYMNRHTRSRTNDVNSYTSFFYDLIR